MQIRGCQVQELQEHDRNNHEIHDIDPLCTFVQPGWPVPEISDMLIKAIDSNTATFSG